MWRKKTCFTLCAQILFLLFANGNENCDKSCRDNIDFCSVIECSSDLAQEACKQTCNLCKPCANTALHENEEVERAGALLADLGSQIRAIRSTQIRGLSPVIAKKGPAIVKGRAEDLFDDDYTTCATIASGNDTSDSYSDFWFQFSEARVDYFEIGIRNLRRRYDEKTLLNDDMKTISIYLREGDRYFRCRSKEVSEMKFHVIRCNSTVSYSRAMIFMFHFLELEVCSVNLFGTKL